MGWGKVLEGAVGAAGALFGAHQSDKATDAVTDAEKEKLALQKWALEQQQHNNAPFMGYGTGQGGLGGLSALMGGDYSGFMNSPDFKARVQLSNQQFNDGAAAKYRLFSGGAQNDRDQLNQNLAAQGLGDYRNALMWGANLGQNAANGIGQASQNFANQAGNAYGNIGNAQATGYGNTAGLGMGLAGLFGNMIGGSSGGGSPFASSYQPTSGYTPSAGAFAGGPNTFWGNS